MELSNEENGDFLRFLVFLCYSISFQFIPFSDFGTPTKSIIARVQGSPKTSESNGPTDLGQSPQIFGLEFGTPRLKLNSVCLPLKSYHPPEKGKDHLPGVYYPNLNGFLRWVPHGFLPGIRSMQLCHDLTVIPIGTARDFILSPTGVTDFGKN